MSGEPFKVGDLAVIVRNHCSDEDVGRIIRVRGFHTWSPAWCHKCWKCVGTHEVVLAEEEPGNEGWPRMYLKRIPPFPELKDERHDEEITA